MHVVSLKRVLGKVVVGLNGLGVLVVLVRLEFIGGFLLA